MAIVRKIEKISLEKINHHTEANATYSIIESEGAKYLQIDTYGSSNRKILGKKSQSIRFSAQAIKELERILQKEFK